jgi:hypothetical protein
MTAPKALIPMADYGHDPTGKASPAPYHRGWIWADLELRDRNSIYCIQESRLRGPICYREWEGARVRQEDASRSDAKATRMRLHST